MKKRPKGNRYRNLTVRGDVIYYQKRVAGKRTRFSADTSDWDEAASVRDEYDQAKRGTQGRGSKPPLFSESAQRYLAEATTHLSRTPAEAESCFSAWAGV